MEDDTTTTAETAVSTWHCPYCETTYPVEGAVVRIIRTSYTQTEEWCRECAENYTVYCADFPGLVSQYFADSALYFWGSDEEWHTEEEPDEYDEENLLLSYGTDVLRVHGWPGITPKDSLCFGVELEMESKERRQFPNMVELLGGIRGNGTYILKADGSLKEGHGAELVTLPYTLEGHQKLFGWQTILSPELLRVARSGRGTNNCGIHVHVNRQALSTLTIGKVLVFLNDPSNDRFVTAIAQRQSGSFCQRDANKKASDARYGSDNRYDILNIGHRTIEFRLFKGNLRPERVLKNVEFCHALIRFCESHSIQDASCRSYFMRFVEKRARDYPHLLAFLVEKGYTTEPSARSTAPYAVLSREARGEA